MRTLRLTYSGKITSGFLKRTNYEYDPPVVDDEQKYSTLVFNVHGLTEALRLRQSLGLSKVPKSQNVDTAPIRAARGSKGISRSGQEVVRSSALWLEDRYGRGRLSFLTLTIPEECLLERLLGRWEALVKNLKTWLQYQLHLAGLPDEIVGVIEVQKRPRGENHDMPGLHIHLVFVGRLHEGGWKLSKSLIQSYWSKALLKASGCAPLSHVSSRVERVRKSAYGYLGKYMSKGVSSLDHINPKYLPSSWYICTLNLRRKVKQLELYVTGEAADWIYDYLQANKYMLRFSQLIHITSDDGRSIPVGWLGQMFNRWHYWALVQLWVEVCDVAPRDARLGLARA